LSTPVDCPVELDAACVELLGEAAEWRLIGLLLSAPQGQWRQQVASVAGDVHDAELLDAARVAQAESDEGLYGSAFGPGGPAPPREISHRPAGLSTQYLAELAGYYDAFGYAPPFNEPVDHVAIEADFIAFLKVKEAFAASRGDADHAAIAREAAEWMMAEHLAYAAGPLADRLATSGLRYMALAAAALRGRVGSLPAAAASALPILPSEDAEDAGSWSCSDAADDADDAPPVW
jgi:hypothetical protein